jgi:hypothetical protein
MSTASHVAIGFLVARYFIDHGWIPAGSINPYVVSIAMANAPDLDGLLSFRQIRTLFDHQSRFKSRFHYPINWILVFTLVSILLVQFRVQHAIIYVVLAITNIIGHFLLDTFSIYGGIAWLWPWKTKRYSFVRNLDMLPISNKQWISWYTKHWVMYLEVALWIVTLVILTNHV